MARERDREAERRDDADKLASVLVCLVHHRVREHGEDRTGREGENEGDGVRRGVLEQAVARETKTGTAPAGGCGCVIVIPVARPPESRAR
jgi:hypothetical protein